MKRNKGFTLIELLVVIAIIGILSSVVLASLNSARAKGNDAAIKSNLSNIRAQAEILYDSNGCYSNSGTCQATALTSCSGANTIFGNANVLQQTAAAATASGQPVVCNTNAGATQWAAAVQLRSTDVYSKSPASGTDYWCVDSSGASKAIDTNITTQTVCP